jgi:hypothetical protein
MGIQWQPSSSDTDKTHGCIRVVTDVWFRRFQVHWWRCLTPRICRIPIRFRSEKRKDSDLEGNKVYRQQNNESLAMEGGRDRVSSP